MSIARSAAEPPPRSDAGRQRSERPRASSATGAARARAPRSLRRSLATAARSLREEFTSPRVLTRYAAWLQAGYLVAICVTWLALITLSEQWLPATLLAYGPRAAVLLPLVVIGPLGLLVARRSLMFTAAGGALALTQIMGFRFGTGPAEPPFRGEAERVSVVRVLTLNVSGGRTSSEALIGLIARVEPDVVSLQECSRPIAAALASLPGWQVATHHSLCTASRWPMGAAGSMPRAEFQRVRQLGFGGAALVARYVIERPGAPFLMANLHLETARKGLEGLMSEEGLLPDGGLPLAGSSGGGSDRVQANALIRTRESEQASQ